MASAEYRPREPEREVLHQLVRDHFETFRTRAAARREGQGLPQFVEREFREFLTCGSLTGGFARFRCASCGADRLVGFSCKGRGFCPSCGGRRMTDRAAHLVDRVLPAVPVRQWVLTLPPRLRYLVAWDHALCRAVVAVYLRAVGGWLRARARKRGIPAGRFGAVAILQRFGSALNLNVHVHALIPDGVFAADAAGRVRFWRDTCGAPHDLPVLLSRIARRIERLLARRGLAGGAEGDDVPDAWAEETPTLAVFDGAQAAPSDVEGRGSRRRPCRASPRWGRAPACRPGAGAIGSIYRSRRARARGTRTSPGLICTLRSSSRRKLRTGRTARAIGGADPSAPRQSRALPRPSTVLGAP